MWQNKKTGPMTSRALLRHGWQTLYYHLTQVEINNATFRWQRTYLHTLHALRSAAYRNARAHHIKCATTYRTNPIRLPTEDDPKGDSRLNALKALEPIIIINPHSLTPATLAPTFANAIEDAADALEKRAAAN